MQVLSLKQARLLTALAGGGTVCGPIGRSTHLDPHSHLPFAMVWLRLKSRSAEVCSSLTSIKEGGCAMDQASPMKILIVDDEPRNRRLLEVFLTAEGYKSLHAGSGQEALALAAAERPNLVLLDLMMPDMDGFQMVQHLKESLATRSIPIIIVSALDDLAARQRVLASGADDFVAKPVNRWELSLRLHHLLCAPPPHPQRCQGMTPG